MDFGILGVHTLCTMYEPVSAVTSCHHDLYTELSFKVKLLFVSIIMVLSQATKISSCH